MRILWIAPYVPAPTFGAGTRVFNLMRGLAPFHDIDLLANASAENHVGAAVADLSRLCRTVQIVPSPISSPRHKRELQLRSLLSVRPAQYWLTHTVAMQEHIDRAVQRMFYDAIILEHSFMGCYLLPHEPLLVVDQHNVESELLLRGSRQERSLLRRTYNLLEHWKYRADEQRTCRQADLVLATSARDCAIMRSWSDSGTCMVLPNGVDCKYFSPRTDIRERPANIVFTGTMHYSPNVEGMRFFVSEIWPLVQQQVPDATLTIVGANPPPAVTKLGRLPSVTVTASVPDVRPFIARAQVVVAPLRIGGGTRLKILEAMAMGKAVVSTSLGCEGLDVKDGRHLLVADEPADFAARIVELFDNPARRLALGSEGRCLVEAAYDWRALGTRLSSTLASLFNERRDPLQAIG